MAIDRMATKVRETAEGGLAIFNGKRLRGKGKSWNESETIRQKKT